jgi:hypothetical protein
MRTLINSAFNRWGIPGNDFEVPNIALAAVPTRNIFGWEFSKTQLYPAYTGAFAPHSILSPAKDNVDVKMWVWWTVDMWAIGGNCPNEKVGWCATMEMLRGNLTKAEDTMPGSLFGLNIGDSAVISAGGRTIFSDLGGLQYPTVRSVSDGFINWNHIVRNSEMGGADLNVSTVHPYSQIATGYKTVETHDVFGEGEQTPYYTTYRTPLYLIRKNASGFYLDPEKTFTQFSRMLETFPIGICLSIYRMQAQTGAAAGDVPDGTFYTDDYNRPVIFLGVEIELV